MVNSQELGVRSKIKKRVAATFHDDEYNVRHVGKPGAPMKTRTVSLATSVAVLSSCFLSATCLASEDGKGVLAPAQIAQSAQPAPAPAAWQDTIKFSGQVEAGITGNPAGPRNDLNFGHLMTDRANDPLLNQLLLTAERPLDPKATGYDFGFKLQGMYGADARYTHFLGELDRTTSARNQWDVVEANATAHLPWLTDGGIDAKLGQYSTPLGSEVIDARGNFFYSHSYIFNFGLPFKHTGVLTTTHVNSMVDVWAGVDTGVNTSLGNLGDNNTAPAGLAGFGLNLLDGKVTVLALSHFGPENARSVPEHNSAFRYLNDVMVVWKVNDKLTSTTELNYIRDDHFGATAKGIAQYLTYAINDQVSVGGRAEVYRDDDSFFVAAFPSNRDFVDAERGLTNTSFTGGRTTYGALTLGLNYKPAVPKPIEGFVIRPELRYDSSLNGTRPFDDGTGKHQFTAAADFVLPF